MIAYLGRSWATPNIFDNGAGQFCRLLLRLTDVGRYLLMRADSLSIDDVSLSIDLVSLMLNLCRKTFDVHLVSYIVWILVNVTWYGGWCGPLYRIERRLCLPLLDLSTLFSILADINANWTFFIQYTQRLSSGQQQGQTDQSVCQWSGVWYTWECWPEQDNSSSPAAAATTND